MNLDCPKCSMEMTIKDHYLRCSECRFEHGNHYERIFIGNYEIISNLNNNKSTIINIENGKLIRLNLTINFNITQKQLQKYLLLA
jgi:hypothetical protein